MRKKKKIIRKTKNKRVTRLAIFLFVLLVVFSFAFGVILGAKKGIAQVGEAPTKRVMQSRMLDVQPVLPTSNIHVPILVYHYVEFVKDPKDSTRRSLDIIPPIFEMQLKTLKEAGYNFITVSELGQYLDGKKQLPQRPVILTFDDGYQDFYTDVFPLLKKYNVVATQYVISGVLDTPNYMTTEQVREVAQSGLVEIGAHTVHHKNLPSLSLEEARVEIEKSREELEKIFEMNIVSFAYPYGGFNDKLAELVKRVGFTSAVTTKGGTIVNQENRYTLFRIHPGIEVGESLLREL